MTPDTEKEAGSLLLKSYGEFFKKQYQDFSSICGDGRWQENRTYLPIQVAMAQTELVHIMDLVASDNTLMTKLLSVMSALCIEVNLLKQEAFDKHFTYLSVFEEYADSDISNQVESVCRLSAFVSRCDETLKNMCSQVFALYTQDIINLNGIQLHYIINHIGELFTLLVLLELMISNTTIAVKWGTFCKKLKAHRHTPQSFNMTEEMFEALLVALNNITIKVFNDDIVQNSLQNIVTLRKSLVDKNCTLAATEFTQYLKLAIANLDKMVQDNPNVNNMYRCIKINSLYVLSLTLFGNIDKKIFKALLELNTKAHSVHIMGTTVWFPEQFLQRHAAAVCGATGKMAAGLRRARAAGLTARRAALSRSQAAGLRARAARWAARTAAQPRGAPTAGAEHIHAQTTLLLDGLDLASAINHSVLTLINLHVALGAPLARSTLMTVLEVVDLLKCIKDAVVRNGPHILATVNMATQHLIFQATSAVLEVKKTLMTDKNYANKRLDELTCLVIAERCLRGPPTPQRLSAAHLALSFVPAPSYGDDTYARLGLLLEKIHALSNFTKSMNAYCDCSWMLWHQHVVPIYLDQNFSLQMNTLKLKYFMMVLEDCALLLNSTDAQYGRTKSKEFVDRLMTAIDDGVIKSTSQNIETNLRLHIHSHLQLDVANPFTFDMTKKLLLVIDNFRLQCVYLSVVPSAEHYLSTMYYNLTTVVLSDWKTYGEMRQMAKFKFNLKTVEDNLPTQTLEQGLDVLEIMRNIHIFVSKYLYNLNNQIFVEKSSNNKHLNSINIRHVANSIRTHGTGIMNTTVNFTYQFLKKKFTMFSQFMYDEHIKSRLIKDLRMFKEISAMNENMYPYKNADKFNKGIKVLGLAEDGQSYLDLFRDLISQIGNAMGYVRMIRSGGRHCCSDATVFLPTLDITKTFKELCEESELSGDTVLPTENLDQNISDLISKFIQGTEYFKLLVDVFAPVFRNPKNVHLKNFFIIVPPLTLNFVDHMILSKDKMSKKNKVGAAFTDDGFAMGIAYILKLLDQDSSFESLQWFDSVWKHIRDERSALEEQKTKGSLQLQQALALTEKKIKTLEDEYKLFYYSLTSARIFFR